MKYTKEKFTMNFDEQIIYAEVSPCSWMYPHYGMQIKISIKENNPNIGCYFINNKSMIVEKATQQDVENMISEFIFKNGIQILKQANEAWIKLEKENDKWIEEDIKRQEIEINKRRSKAKNKGYNFETIAVVHPSNGDDYKIIIHSAEELSEYDISKKLKSRKSEVFNDFIQIAI